jgi:hypothetical protein
VIPSQFLTMSPKISLERVLLEILIPAALQRSLCIGFERRLATALIVAEGKGHPTIVPTVMIDPGGRPRYVIHGGSLPHRTERCREEVNSSASG